MSWCDLSKSWNKICCSRNMLKLFQSHYEWLNNSFAFDWFIMQHWTYINIIYIYNIIFDLIWLLDFFCVISKKNSLWLSWHGGSTVCFLINVWFTWWLAEEAVTLVVKPALAVERALGVEAGSKRMTELQKTLISICKRRQWWAFSEIKCITLVIESMVLIHEKGLNDHDLWMTLNHWWNNSYINCSIELNFYHFLYDFTNDLHRNL